MAAQITVKRVRNGFRLESELWLPRPRAEVFPFFANAFNLQTLTPPFLNFRVVTPSPIEMRVGLRIDYRLRLHGLPLRWQSEITVWEPPHRFVDEQRRGPYRRRVHEHRFEGRQDGTQVSDSVHYAVYGGRLIERLFVRHDVQNIFAYRHQRLLEIFASPAP